jgi:DNA-binding CsgD family transcriptional regulator
MDYISALEASKKWSVSLRQVQRLLAGGRIPGAKKYGRSWMLPADAKKPGDLRRKKKPLPNALSDDLCGVISATTVPMSLHNPDAILNTVTDRRLQLIYEGELAYLRGDFRRTLRCFYEAEGDDAARLRSCTTAIAAAISLGDYDAYTEIEAYLKTFVKTGEEGNVKAFAELALATAAVSVIAPNMAPGWLKDGDFDALVPQMKPDALYLRAKYLNCVGSIEAMLAVAQTALTLSAPERGITMPDIYLRMTCAVACHTLGREEEARRYLLGAMRICLPHGFLTPFAELVAALGGLAEQCLEQEFPGCRDAVIGQWQLTWRNWVAFHNLFTKDHITLMLSLREYHLAVKVARRIPYADIAEQHHLSVGRLKNIMLEIYGKLLISGRDELSKYVL